MNYGEKFKNFISESKRVFRVTKKPTKEEFLTISKVSAIGILVIGFIGFVFNMIDQITALWVSAVAAIVVVVALMLWNRKQ